MSTKRTFRGAPNGASQHNGNASSEEEDGQGRMAPSPPTAPARQSARRQPRVDLSRLETASLRKYRRVYKLGDMSQGVSKEDLVPAVMHHWQNQVVEEEYETLLEFVVALRKRSMAGEVAGSSRDLHKVRQKPGPKPKR